MSVSKVPKVPYRDDPDAISLHTTPDDVQYSDDVSELPGESSSLPPSYNETAYYVDPDWEQYGGISSISDPQTHFSGISSSKSIFQKECRIQISGEHVVIQNPQADTNPEYLEGWIKYMSRQTPSPYIVIMGTHSEQQLQKDGKKKSVEVTDFRICINLQNYLWPNFRQNDPAMMELHTVDNGERVWRGTVLKTRAPGTKNDIEVGGEAKPTLREWCHRYCASTSKTRMFRLTRTVVGLNEQNFSGPLTSYIRSTNYRGHLNIYFPVADRAVDVYSSSLLNEWRLTTWIKWLFYLTFLWIFSWPVLYLTTKRYNVVKAVWKFSKPDALGNPIYTTVSESQWVKKFGPAVRQLALDRYEGVVGDDMLNQVLARPEALRPVPAEFEAVANGVGTVVDIFNNRTNSASGNVVNSVLRFAGGSRDAVGWGYDT